MGNYKNILLLLGGLEHEIYFFHILGIIILIFFRGVETTNQIYFLSWVQWLEYSHYGDLWNLNQFIANDVVTSSRDPWNHGEWGSVPIIARRWLVKYDHWPRLLIGCYRGLYLPGSMGTMKFIDKPHYLDIYIYTVCIYIYTPIVKYVHGEDFFDVGRPVFDP